jgi:ABC-2 type transport system permease protein
MRGIYGVFRRESARYLRVKMQTILAPLVSSILFYLIFGMSLGKTIAIPGYSSYLEFLIPGLTMLSLMMSGFDNNSSTLIIGKFANEVQDYRIVPLSIWELAWGFAFAGFIRGIIIAGATFAIGEFTYLYLHGSFFPIYNVAYTLLITLFSGFTFAFFGTGIGMISKNFDTYIAIHTFILTPLIYLGGSFYDIATLPPVWQIVSRCNPIAYLIGGMRYGFSGNAFASPSLMLALALAFVIAALFFAIFHLKKAKNYQ